MQRRLYIDIWRYMAEHTWAEAYWSTFVFTVNSFFYYHNEDVNKKIDLNIFQIDQGIAILRLKCEYRNSFINFLLPNKNHIISVKMKLWTQHMPWKIGVKKHGLKHWKLHKYHFQTFFSHFGSGTLIIVWRGIKT